MGNWKPHVKAKGPPDSLWQQEGGETRTRPRPNKSAQAPGKINNSIKADLSSQGQGLGWENLAPDTQEGGIWSRLPLEALSQHKWSTLLIKI